MKTDNHLVNVLFKAPSKIWKRLKLIKRERLDLNITFYNYILYRSVNVA